MTFYKWFTRQDDKLIPFSHFITGYCYTPGVLNDAYYKGSLIFGFRDWNAAQDFGMECVFGSHLKRELWICDAPTLYKEQSKCAVNLFNDGQIRAFWNGGDVETRDCWPGTVGVEWIIPREKID